MQSAPVELPGEGLKGAAGGIRSSGLTNPTEYQYPVKEGKDLHLSKD